MSSHDYFEIEEAWHACALELQDRLKGHLK